MTQASEESKNFPARPDKTINWLNKSRDEWKGKTQTTKAELKVAKQAQKRARQSRQEWRAQYRQLEKQQAVLLEEKSEEIENLKTKVQELEHENAGLKKKYWLRLMTKN
jgi:predicted  nucleic acid-binding Zn-ribbon protein